MKGDTSLAFHAARYQNTHHTYTYIHAHSYILHISTFGVLKLNSSLQAMSCIHTLQGGYCNKLNPVYFDLDYSFFSDGLTAHVTLFSKYLTYFSTS